MTTERWIGVITWDAAKVLPGGLDSINNEATPALDEFVRELGDVMESGAILCALPLAEPGQALVFFVSEEEQNEPPA